MQCPGRVFEVFVRGLRIKIPRLSRISCSREIFVAAFDIRGSSVVVGTFQSLLEGNFVAAWRGRHCQGNHRVLIPARGKFCCDPGILERMKNLVFKVLANLFCSSGLVRLIRTAYQITCEQHGIANLSRVLQSHQLLKFLHADFEALFQFTSKTATLERRVQEANLTVKGARAAKGVILECSLREIVNRACRWIPRTRGRVVNQPARLG
jgi:hypothetical protein